MNSLPTSGIVGWNHTDVCHKELPPVSSGLPQKNRFRLEIFVQITRPGENECKVYTPMDVDDPTLYNPGNCNLEAVVFFAVAAEAVRPICESGRERRDNQSFIGVHQLTVALGFDA